ncbi:hypothetical protein DMB37_25355 [Nocardia sp. CS682]|nr:hypothetical protein DMB37_25355 [Nocardia sp. CS682]
MRESDCVNFSEMPPIDDFVIDVEKSIRIFESRIYLFEPHTGMNAFPIPSCTGRLSAEPSNVRHSPHQAQEIFLHVGEAAKLTDRAREIALIFRQKPAISRTSNNPAESTDV